MANVNTNQHARRPATRLAVPRPFPCLARASVQAGTPRRTRGTSTRSHTIRGRTRKSQSTWTRFGRTRSSARWLPPPGGRRRQARLLHGSPRATTHATLRSPASLRKRKGRQGFAQPRVAAVARARAREPFVLCRPACSSAATRHTPTRHTLPHATPTRMHVPGQHMHRMRKTKFIIKPSLV